jgi:hypothetical protein
MKIFTNNVEAKLVDFANSTRGRSEDYYVLHFRLSKLSEAYKSDFQIKIAINILNDLFRQERAEICKAANLDVFLLYHGNDRALIGKAVFQLRYLFFDDALATLPDGRENKDFCEVYDLNFQWSQFSIFASRLMGDSLNAVLGKEAPISSSPERLNPMLLAEVEAEIDKIRLDECVRMQPICTIKSVESVKPLFHEIYINIPTLQKKLGSNYNLTADKWLFLYLTNKLDEKVLESISINPENFLYMPLSLNLNIATVLSQDFAEFCEIAKDFKCQLLIEVSVADIFTDTNGFFRALDFCRDRNHKVCIDGLNNESFIQINRRKLGFDLVKLQWNADMLSDLETKDENLLLKAAVEASGANRVILCRCDDINAIDYGFGLGISLFQGRFPDRILNPKNIVIN